MQTALCPIAIFGFNRPDHLRKTLESLAHNDGVNDGPIYFFCDGPRTSADEALVAQTQRIAEEFDHPNKHLHFSDKNRGLKESITRGIDMVFLAHDRIIVLEDDLDLSPSFLAFMRKSLDFYRDDDAVIQISGSGFPLNINTDSECAYFLPFISSWGWATWKDRWQDFRNHDMTTAKEELRNPSWRWRFDVKGSYPYSRMLLKTIEGRNSSWAIWLNLYAFDTNRLTLYPKRSLVTNFGFDGTGTNCGSDANAPSGRRSGKEESFALLPSKVEINDAMLASTARYLRRNRGLVRYLADSAYRIFGLEVGR